MVYLIKKLKNIFNEEKVLGKTNWYDTTILKILENEIYKGDFVHGKRTKHPTLLQRCCRAFSIKRIVGGMSGATEKEF